MNGETVKYHYYESNKRSFITIPVSLARAKNWEHGDKIGILSHTQNGIEGYFIWNRKMSGNISGKVKNFVFERDNVKCIYCGSFENLEFDHIIPANKGGSNTERNIQLVCMKCNRVKFNYIDDDDILKKKKKPKQKKKNKFEEIIISKKRLRILNWNDDDNISVLIEEGKMNIIKNRIKGYHTKISINQDGYGVIKMPLNVMFA